MTVNDFETVMTSNEHGHPVVNAPAARREYDRAVGANADLWVVGGRGSEVPFLSDRRWFLYVWNPRTSEHGYLDLSTDVVERVG